MLYSFGQQCMSDVTMAIAEGYPVEQQHKLLLRRADCHIELGALTDAKAAIAAAIQHASTLSLTSAQSSELYCIYFIFVVAYL